MTAQDHGSQSDDARLRQALAEMNSDTSALHDDAVLARARAVASEIAADAAAPEAKARRSLDWTRPLGLAAAVAIAVVGLSWILPGTHRDSEQLRGADSAAAVFPEPGVVLEHAPAELRWAAQPGAREYRVTLRDATATVVWESAGTANPRVDLGSELRPGGTYFWTVSVDGTAAAGELGPFMFRIAD